MKNKINWKILFIIILSIALMSTTLFIINSEKEKISNIKPEKIYVGHEDEEPLDNFSKLDAVTSMGSILESIGQDIEGENRTVEERMQTLDKGKGNLENIINKKTIDMLYLEEEFKNNEFNNQFIASALLSYHKLTSDENGKVSAATDFVDEMVYLDSYLKTAHIPLDIYIGENKGISFEMQYINGEWKFNPYTSMMALVMIINYENQIKEMKE